MGRNGEDLELEEPDLVTNPEIERGSSGHQDEATGGEREDKERERGAVEKGRERVPAEEREGTKMEMGRERQTSGNDERDTSGEEEEGTGMTDERTGFEGGEGGRSGMGVGVSAPTGRERLGLAEAKGKYSEKSSLDDQGSGVQGTGKEEEGDGDEGAAEEGARGTGSGGSGGVQGPQGPQAGSEGESVSGAGTQVWA